MTTVDIYSIAPSDFPPLLKEIPDPPTALRVRGTLPDPETHRFLAVVGSRKYSEYGKKVARHLISKLKGHPICVVSGLALGIDAIAHTTALENDLPTIAIPGSGLSDAVLYPKSNRGLAGKILEADGALISEYEDNFKAEPWSFPKRNRIMAGMSHATLVIEAEEKSGTLITARLAAEYNREVLAVPGSLFSKTAAGTHHLIERGAIPVRTKEDILEALKLQTEQKKLFDTPSPKEEKVLSLLREPKTKEEIESGLDLPHHEIERLLESLLSKEMIRERMGQIERWI